jgi:large subunit ribosomal protein L4e
MKAQVRDLSGKKIKDLELPKAFERKVRLDVLAKVLEARRNEQPFGPSPVAGKQHSASGITIHRRHVWKSGYGRGKSRVPRKVFSVRGTQFNWEGATSPNTRGGRRAHPPKVIARMNTLKINKKENQIAFESALSASMSEKWILEKYDTLKGKKINAPFIIDKIGDIKVKELLKGLRNVLGVELENVAFKKREVRAGRGKMRGRKYKSNAGLLLVTGKDEFVKTKVIDVAQANSLNAMDLAKGGPGRITIYTENAINEIGERIK